MFFFSVIGAIQMRYDDDDDKGIGQDCEGRVWGEKGMGEKGRSPYTSWTSIR